MSKPSFFDKISGAIQTPEAPSANIATKTAVKSPAKDKPQSNQEQWLEQAEGQLSLDVYQTPNEIVIRSTIAGVKPEDLDITISNDMVTVRGRRENEETVKGEDYYYQECYWGSFSRSVILPVDVEADNAKATLKNGVFTLRLPKIEKVKTRKISVQLE